jgi:hypothetical protein
VHCRSVARCHRPATVRTICVTSARATQICARRCRPAGPGTEITACRSAVGTALRAGWAIGIVAAGRAASAVTSRARRTRRARTVVPRIRPVRCGHSRMRCYSIHFVASRHKTRCFRRMPNDWSRPRFRFQNFRRRCSHNQTDLRCYIRRHSFRLRSLLRNSRLIAVTARLRTRRHPTAPSTDIPTTDRPRFRARILHCSGRCSNERRLRLTGRN